MATDVASEYLRLKGEIHDAIAMALGVSSDELVDDLPPETELPQPVVEQITQLRSWLKKTVDPAMIFKTATIKTIFTDAEGNIMLQVYDPREHIPVVIGIPAQAADKYGLSGKLEKDMQITFELVGGGMPTNIKIVEKL